MIIKLIEDVDKDDNNTPLSIPSFRVNNNKIIMIIIRPIKSNLHRQNTSLLSIIV